MAIIKEDGIVRGKKNKIEIKKKGASLLPLPHNYQKKNLRLRLKKKNRRMKKKIKGANETR
jgi:hypothetical protein